MLLTMTTGWLESKDVPHRTSAEKDCSSTRQCCNNLPLQDVQNSASMAGCHLEQTTAKSVQQIQVKLAGDTRFNMKYNMLTIVTIHTATLHPT